MDLIQRFKSTAIVVPLLLFMMQWDELRLVLVCFVNCQCMFELLGSWDQIAFRGLLQMRYLLDYITSIAVLISAYIYSLETAFIVLFASFSSFLVLEMVHVSMKGESPEKELLLNMAFRVFAHVYLDLPLAFAVALHNLRSSENNRDILLVLVLVVLADNGGLIVGRFMGYTLLSPLLSPRKTWQGVLGSVLFSVVGSVYLSPYLSSSSDALQSVILGCTVAVFGVMGDLAESLIKRCLIVKDMGCLLPGWGGLLDRADSCLFVFPIVYMGKRIDLF